MCLSRTRGDQPLDTMGHSGARKHDRMCSVEHDASPGEKRRGTMVYMLTTPTCTSSIAQLRVRVCGVGSRRERVRVRIALLHCICFVRGIMQTCSVSMAYDNQRIKDVVDDAA